MDEPRFFVMIECPRCDAEVHYGPVLTLLEERGLPVMTTDVAAQESFECDECGLNFYTGELEIYYEDDQPDFRDYADDEDEDEAGESGD